MSDKMSEHKSKPIRELIVEIDSYHELLGVELLPALNDGYFDPDLNFTPLEHRLNLLMDALGLDQAEIRKEAMARSREILYGHEEGEE